jgi:hypothetical protein
VRLLVTGGRDYRDSFSLECALSEVAAFESLESLVIVHGAARGADTLAAEWAERMGYKDDPYPADWDSEGKAAGVLRNQRMLETGIDYAIVCPGGRGTRDMMERLFNAGVPFKYIGR